MRKYVVGMVLLLVICIPIITKSNTELSDIKIVENFIESLSKSKIYIHAPSAHSENDGFYEVVAEKKETILNFLDELDLSNFEDSDISNFFGPSVLIKVQNGSMSKYLRIVSMDSVYVIVFIDEAENEIQLVGQDENFNFIGLNQIVLELLRQSAED